MVFKNKKWMKIQDENNIFATSLDTLEDYSVAGRSGLPPASTLTFMSSEFRMNLPGI